jgi:hypothetical protein
MATKVTFTIDEVTLARLQDAASRLAVSKSEVVRKAIAEFHGRVRRVNERKRASMSRSLQEYLATPATRKAGAVDRELRDIREARRTTGRRSGERKTA